MWKAAAGAQLKVDVQNNVNEDDWETDPDFINDVDEQAQRWGSTTVEGSGRTAGAIDMERLRKETEEIDIMKKKKALEEDPSNPSYGYGGKFGVQKDRMDKCALGHDYLAKLEKHASQKDYCTGFGGKYGVQTDRQDKSAVGWDHVEKIEKHESQKDYTQGFGGKFGVQADRQDKSAVGWDHHEMPQKHESQLDHKKGFGGKFGVQTDRIDKSATTYNDTPDKVGTNYTRVKPDIGDAKPSNLRVKFETLAKETSARSDGTKPSVPAPKQFDASKTAFLRQSKFESLKKETSDGGSVVTEIINPAPKQLDASKTAFLRQPEKNDISTEQKTVPNKLDGSSIAQFNNDSNMEPVKEEVKEPDLDVTALQKEEEERCIQMLVQEKENEEMYDKLQVEGPEYTVEEDEYYSQHEIIDTGISAIALYDYQAAADDEISFDPDDIITHIEQIDEGWWRGLCKGKYGLFPANYVELQNT